MNALLAETSPGNALPPAYRLGEYIIQSVLGHGGFGITYLARDTKLSSRVAIKEYFPQAFAIRNRQSTIVPKSTGAEPYRWGLQEFLKEARALAKFKHNHIVRVLRFLEANGTAYMVMEYEEGESLASYLRKTGGYLNESTLLSVFLPILSGLQAVHDTGLLHLDIKPDNIYLRTNGQPMLIDFGSARQIRSRSDKDQKIALTPAYAALEHYPNLGKQGPWTDVYSIGATLYSCVTGLKPIGAMDRYQALCERKPDPHQPTTTFKRPLYASHIRECVEWAMQLFPKDRPHTAFALQRGLMGHGMTNEKSMPQSAVNYRSGFIGIAKVAAPQEGLTQIRRGILEKGLIGLVVGAAFGIFALKFLLQNDSITDTQLFDSIAYVEKTAREIAKEAEQAARRALGIQSDRRREDTNTPAVQPQRSFEQEHVNPLDNSVLADALTKHTERIDSLIFLADGSLLGSVTSDGVVKFWYVETGALLRTFDSNETYISAVAVSPDSRWLATASDKNTISLWDINKHTQGARLIGHNEVIQDIAFSPDGRILASASQDQTVILWDLEKQQIMRKIGRFEQNVLTVAFSPNGRWLATGDTNGEVKYWTVSTGKEVANFKVHEEEVTAIAFSPDGKWVASGGTENFLKLWSIGVDQPDRTLKGVPDTVRTVTFTPDNKSLVAVGTDNLIQMWNVETGELTHRLDSQNSERLPQTNDQQPFADFLTGEVEKVSDGDTIYVLDDTNKRHKILLAGIDAPEKNQAYGLASREYLTSLVADKRVMVEYQTGDRYGRMLGKVWLQGVDVCLAQIKAGFAWHSEHYQNEQGSEDRELYAEAENQARAEKLGLWRDKSPTPPWEFRRGHGSR